MKTCIFSPLEEALIRVVKKCNCDKSDCPSLFSKSNGVNSCIVFVYGEESTQVVPTGKEMLNEKKCENQRPLKPCSVVLA